MICLFVCFFLRVTRQVISLLCSFFKLNSFLSEDYILSFNSIEHASFHEFSERRGGALSFFWVERGGSRDGTRDGTFEGLNSERNWVEGLGDWRSTKDVRLDDSFRF